MNKNELAHYSQLLSDIKEREGWGAKVIPRLAVDLKNELPEEKGFSPANLKRMVRFWSEYPALCSIDAQPARQIAIEASATVGNEISAPSVRQSPNRTIEHPDEILCQTKDRIIAEYSLRDIEKPIGVADYELTRALPEKLASSLPSIEAIEAELSQNLAEEES